MEFRTLKYSMRYKKFLPPTIIIALMMIVVYVWHQFFYEPAQREILYMQLETRRLQQMRKEISDFEARYGDLAAFVEKRELELERAQNLLPETLRAENFVDELYQTADSLGVRIISIRAGEVTSAENLQSQIISVSLQTDYISLLNFIREIIDGERLANLEKISAEHLRGKTLSCELDFKIFAAEP